MARDPKKGDRTSKRRRSKKRAPRRRSAPKQARKKVAAKGAKIASKAVRRASGTAGTKAERAALARELDEARQRQAATAEVLNLIARSPHDVKPVFDTIVRTIVRLVQCDRAFVMRCEGDSYVVVATAALDGTFIGLANTARIDPASNFPSRAIVSKKTVYYPDWSLTDLPEYEGRVRDRYGMNCSVYLPLLRQGECIGLFALATSQTNWFDDGKIALAESFRDQAVIAIENARLFNETKEALERQTATSDILRVIASSPSDVQPVFEAIAESARRVIGGHSSIVTRVIGDQLHLAAFTAATGTAKEVLEGAYPQPLSSPSFISPRVVRTGKVIAYADTEKEGTETSREIARVRGYRSLLAVPMMRDGIAIGTINVTRAEPGGFDENTIGLMKTFADQAVIAIENTRLFNETREALERQTATADILKVIASSPDNVQPVFDAIAERSNRLVNGLSTAVYGLVDDIVHLMAFTRTGPEADAALQATFPMPLSRLSWGEAIRLGEVSFVEDAEVEFVTRPIAGHLARLRGWRSWLGVPLLRDGNPIGVITVTRIEPGRFDDRYVQILKTFADQAVIAISNVELFQEVQQRTRELSQSLDDLRAAQDRLVQTEKLASLGQLTAGIAHEIKNPLNFVNNFSALSAELVGELNEALAPLTFDQKTKSDVGELTQMLKSNLEKVVQHGKRADSIVKNMLLHSREGSGERRSVEVNALVEESLNLAYHGARAERPGFQVTLKHDLDPNAGTIELYPQEMTRVLLNMISNGFYAVTERAGAAGNGFEPTLMAATKGLSDRVEIRIRDNGTGIPPEVKEKMFNPFFTTKPAGEGTGLGLSMSHDIIVKQHGGTIDVETEPGHFTEFIIVLPRASHVQNRKA